MKLWITCQKCLTTLLFFSHFFYLFTYNFIWRRCTGYVALHLSSLSSHCILDWITRDNGRTCTCQNKKKWMLLHHTAKITSKLGVFLLFKVSSKYWYIKLCGFFLTVDCERDLSLSYSNPWDDGLTYILASIRLAHRLQIQLVAVTQNLWGSEKRTQI